MILADLADIVAVRNHILTVLNDKSVSTKDDFRPLNDVRIKLDKLFVSTLREINIESLLGNKTTPPPPPEEDKQLSLNYVADRTETTWENADTVIDHPYDQLEAMYQRQQKREDPVVEANQQSKSIETSTDDEEQDLALIAARVKAQKELLKKEGRSNKRTPKATENDSSK
jgi:hypothetical protein